ncbi:MAG: DUF362 domain-containing protein [Bryobacterales bacterium]|nr:DUF362 domain-containing protein [Bryobacterales bacterium]
MQLPLNRRELFQAALATALSRKLLAGAQVSPAAPLSKLAIPGLYRGKVVAVEHSGSIIAGRYQAEPVRQMMRRGMGDLTGAATWADAWKQFVKPGEIVGIKVNPVGQPQVISAPEVLREIIDGLRAAGIPNKDIVVYDRYRDQFYQAGFDKWLPAGVRVSNAVGSYDAIQLDIKGYDPEHYMEMALTHPGHNSVEARRSYAAKFITREVDKLINLCVLKDHQSAGITLSLKNLSHGLVNNVSRSHSTVTLNACGAFIPAVVAMPVIRNKAVLHVLDGVKGQYHGGPPSNPKFIWEHKTMYFATDPVALDHIGWEVIDAKRVSAGMKRLVEDRPDQYSTYVHRQPEHVEIAGALGLGVWDRAKIDFKAVKLA